MEKTTVVSVFESDEFFLALGKKNIKYPRKSNNALIGGNDVQNR